MSEKLLLIDGNNLLFRMFFGIPSAIKDTNGKDIRGAVGFIGSIKKFITEFQSNDIIVVFDSETPSRKYSEDADYKKNRIMDYGVLPESQDPFTQMQDIKDSLSYLSIPFIEISRCEADDIIASLCVRYSHSYKEIIIISTDKDYFQLISDTVHVLSPRGRNSMLYTRESLLSCLGIPPEKYIFFSSLIGDKSDNISGIHGIGKVTAATIVNQYPSVEDLFRSLDRLNPAVKRRLEGQQQHLLRNMYLISMDTHLEVEIPYLPQIDSFRMSENTVEIIRHAREQNE